MGIDWDREIGDELGNRVPWEELEARYGFERATVIRLLENATWQLQAFVKAAGSAAEVRVPVEQLAGAVEAMKRAQKLTDSDEPAG